jgi:TonB-dependent starch-binding outer membrane protein SusC
MTKFYLFSRYLTVLLFLMMLSTMAFSQGRTVSGTITSSDDGSALPGVNIVEKGTSKGTISSADGSYTIDVSENATLVFSFVGYKATEVPVAGQTTINVTLENDVTALSEVVVIGYGEVNKRDATGAVTSVSAKDFNPGVIASPEQLIQGKTAGVQMTSTTGNPGDGVQLRIRGANSIRSNNNPLFVVDGVPLSGGTQPASADLGLGSSGDTNPLNFLNPSDIESISILKDASATAIYGSRAANGVVIITTKRGKGAGLLEFTSNLSYATAAKKYDLLDREEFLAAIDQYGGDVAAQDRGASTDWQDYILRNSISHKQNLAYSRAFGTTTLRASAGYEDQQGIIEDSFMKRITGKINAGKTFMDEKLHLDLSTTFSNTRRQDPPVSGNSGFQGDLLGAAYSANPTWPTDPAFDPGGQRSPANMLNTYKSTGTTNRILANFSADYKLMQNLSVKGTYGFDWADADRVTIVNGEAINVGPNAGFGAGQLNVNKNINHLFELTATYDKKAGNVDINFVAGYSVQSFRNQWGWAIGKGFTDIRDFDNMEDELRDNFDAGEAAAGSFFGDYNNWGISNDLRVQGQPSQVGGFVNGIDFDGGSLEQEFFPKPAGVTLNAIGANFYDQTDYLQSYFGRGNFTINNKYIITATIRADGSSRFGDENKYGVFPSGAVAWQLHEEDFLPEAFSTVKLRAGYGIVGNQDGLSYGEFIRRERWADVSVGDSREINVPGSSTQGGNRQDLKWEQTSQLAIGVDFGFMNDRLSGSIDWYNKETTDLLLRYVPAQPALESIIFQNLDATVENKGWEFSLSYAAIDNEQSGLTISGNISQNKNMVEGLAGEFDAGQIYGQGLSGAYAQRLAGGYPLFSYHLREFEGFDENGQPIGDVQGFVGKSALPEWNMGFSVTGRYKNFDVVMNLVGQFGFYVYNNTKNAFFTAGSINNGRNVTPDVLTSGESGSAEAAVSTRFLEKGDFVRMQNLTVGYRVPMSGNGAVKSLRLSLGGQNLFLITDYSGLDPEVSTNPANYSLLNSLPTAGIDYAAYPRPRIFTFGLNATF